MISKRRRLVTKARSALGKVFGYSMVIAALFQLTALTSYHSGTDWFSWARWAGPYPFLQGLLAFVNYFVFVSIVLALVWFGAQLVRRSLSGPRSEDSAVLLLGAMISGYLAYEALRNPWIFALGEDLKANEPLTILSALAIGFWFILKKND
jgi:hypothetical protein